jgi:hypothetical protein
MSGVHLHAMVHFLQFGMQVLGAILQSIHRDVLIPPELESISQLLFHERQFDLFKFCLWRL